MVIRRILGLIGTSVLPFRPSWAAHAAPRKLGWLVFLPFRPSWAAHAAPRKPGWLMTELIWLSGRMLMLVASDPRLLFCTSS